VRKDGKPDLSFLSKLFPFSGVIWAPGRIGTLAAMTG
jgi:hypothetical protein